MKHASGSTVLVLIVVMSGVVILTSLVWRTVAFSVDATVARQLQYQTFYYAEGIRRWGVAFVIHNFDILQARHAHGEIIQLDMSSWPVRVPTLSSCTSTLIFKIHNSQTISIETGIMSDNASSHTSCYVKRTIKEDETALYSVTNFTCGG